MRIFAIFGAETFRKQDRTEGFAGRILEFLSKRMEGRSEGGGFAENAKGLGFLRFNFPATPPPWIVPSCLPFWNTVYALVITRNPEFLESTLPLWMNYDEYTYVLGDPLSNFNFNENSSNKRNMLLVWSYCRLLLLLDRGCWCKFLQKIGDKIKSGKKSGAPFNYYCLRWKIIFVSSILNRTEWDTSLKAILIFKWGIKTREEINKWKWNE